ncbi:MAG: hypothetical protein CMG57_08320 [Candidatus Marinimicrobia bacterium]|nr:hypothetical protein [Candidatus Neomarinimicrobiota bacterium]|tara:strand:+ start:14947 stop:15612 length:666 start_codon:yes stop_codon:yes gene_type:complete
MKGSIVGLIPVKGSSDRVKKKNLRDFAGSSLLEVKLNQLKDAKGFENIIVSSEDDEVLNIAKKHGFSTHIRDPKYSTSEVPMSDVYSYIASEIEGDNIAWINVTNPLAETIIYNKAVELYNDIDSSYDCLLSSILLQENVFYEGLPVNFTPYPWPKSQDLKGLNSLTFVINILKRKDMVSWGSCVGNAPYFYDLDKIDSWDIDDQADFEFCEFIYKKRINK